MGSVEVESFNPANFNPAPFPKELPTYELPRISLAKLIEGDEKEAKAVFDICARSSFFNLNLMDHPLGRRLWENGCKARNIGQQTMSTVSMEEKNAFLKREGVVILDRGYTGTTKDSQGLAKFVESINVRVTIIHICSNANKTILTSSKLRFLVTSFLLKRRLAGNFPLGSRSTRNFSRSFKRTPMLSSKSFSAYLRNSWNSNPVA
jgi:hypothetical protein